MREKIVSLYSNHYKKMLFVPAVLFIAFFVIAFVFPGVPKGIDFVGGTVIILRTDKPIEGERLESLINQNFQLTELSVTSISSPSGYGATIKFAKDTALSAAGEELEEAQELLDSAPKESWEHSKKAILAASAYLNPMELSDSPETALEQAKDFVEKARQASTARMQELIAKEFGVEQKNIALQRQVVSPSLGKSFFDTALNVSVFSVVLLTLVIFVLFRRLIPSLAMIGAAGFDILTALAFMAVLQIPLSLSSIPALLMLVGYSVDTEILMTTRMLKRKEGLPAERIFDSLSTGLTMTITAMTAALVMIVFSWLNQILVLYTIAAVVLFGLFGDIISTNFMNAPLLLWLEETQKQKR